MIPGAKGARVGAHMADPGRYRDTVAVASTVINSTVESTHSSIAAVLFPGPHSQGRVGPASRPLGASAAAVIGSSKKMRGGEQRMGVQRIDCFLLPTLAGPRIISISPRLCSTADAHCSFINPTSNKIFSARCTCDARAHVGNLGDLTF